MTDDSQTFDAPDAGDVHVNGPIGALPASKRSPLVRRLLKRLKTHFTTAETLTADEFVTHYRSALGHAGGTAAADKRKSNAEGDMLGDWEPCASCVAGNTADCTCPACAEGDPQDCLCAEVMADQQQAEGYTEGSAHIHAEGTDFRLFLPVEFAEAPQWIPLLPKPGTFKHPRYGDIQITPQRNADFVSKFNAGVYQNQVPLDAEHQTKLSGAMGWITQLRQNSDGSADAQVDWTDRGRTMLADNRYRYISPEWFDRWRQPDTGQDVDNVIIGAALTTRPFFKDSALRPLVASEQGILVPDEDSSPVPSGTQSQRPNGQELQMTELTDEQKRFSELEAELKSLTEERDTLVAERDAAKSATEELSSTLASATERIGALESAARRREFSEVAATWFGDTNKHVSLMERLSDEDRATYSEQQSAIAEQLKASKAFSAIGVTGSETEDTAEAKLRVHAEEIRQGRPELSSAQAFSEAMNLHPDLYQEYMLGN